MSINIELECGGQEVDIEVFEDLSIQLLDEELEEQWMVERELGEDVPCLKDIEYILKRPDAFRRALAKNATCEQLLEWVALMLPSAAMAWEKARGARFDDDLYAEMLEMQILIVKGEEDAGGCDELFDDLDDDMSVNRKEATRLYGGLAVSLRSHILPMAEMVCSLMGKCERGDQSQAAHIAGAISASAAEIVAMVECGERIVNDRKLYRVKRIPIKNNEILNHVSLLVQIMEQD